MSVVLEFRNSFCCVLVRCIYFIFSILFQASHCASKWQGDDTSGWAPGNQFCGSLNRTKREHSEKFGERCRFSINCKQPVNFWYIFWPMLSFNERKLWAIECPVHYKVIILNHIIIVSIETDWSKNNHPWQRFCKRGKNRPQRWSTTTRWGWTSSCLCDSQQSRKCQESSGKGIYISHYATLHNINDEMLTSTSHLYTVCIIFISKYMYLLVFVTHVCRDWENYAPKVKRIFY